MKKDEEEKKQLIVFPRGSLDAETKALLLKNGYFGIEADNPKEVVTVLPLAPLAVHLVGDEIVQAMASAMGTSESVQRTFGQSLIASIRTKKP